MEKRKSRHIATIASSPNLGDNPQERRKAMHSAIFGVLEAIEKTYPYAYDGDCKAKYSDMDRNDCRFHFLYCIGQYEESSDTAPLPNPFVELIWDFLYWNFYMVEDDNMKAIREYMAYIIEPNTDKSERDIKFFGALYKRLK